MAYRPDHVLEDFRHNRAGHRCGIVEAAEIVGGFQDLYRLREIEIEVTRLSRDGFVASPKQGNPGRQAAPPSARAETIPRSRPRGRSRRC